jgi:DNA modification methylase
LRSRRRLGLTDEDAAPELLQVATSRRDDLWLMGGHKLRVGDARKQQDLDRLMAGDAADLVFIDPPYNVAYEGYTEDHLTIKGDRMTGRTSDASWRRHSPRAANW